MRKPKSPSFLNYIMDRIDHTYFEIKDLKTLIERRLK